MNALTISEPHASRIAAGDKWVENRTWETLRRGPLAIHAGKGSRYLTAKQLREYPHRGCVIAVAQLVAVFHIRAILENAELRPDTVAPHCRWTWAEIAAHEHTEGPFCWMLGSVEQLATPLPLKGRLGLFDVDATLLNLKR